MLVLDGSSVKATDLLSDSATSFINMEWAWPVWILVEGLGVATSALSNDRLEADLWGNFWKQTEGLTSQ